MEKTVDDCMRTLGNAKEEGERKKESLGYSLIIMGEKMPEESEHVHFLPTESSLRSEDCI